MKLTDEEKKEFFKKFNSGDIGGLEYLDKLIKERVPVDYSHEDLRDISNFVIKLNAMISFAEDFDGVCNKLYDKIEPLYYSMKMELLDACGITDKDFETYEGV